MKSEKDYQLSGQNLSTTVASVSTREIQEIDSKTNDYYMKVAIPDEYRIDAKPFIERPFYAGEVTFPSTAARYSLLTTPIQFLPGDVVRSNTSLTNMFKMGAYGRPDLVLSISLAGTITHAGCVLVGVLPPLPDYPTTPSKRLINTILTGPHAFLHANEATSVAITVPWYCNTDMATLDMEQTTGYRTSLDIIRKNGNYATLVFFVLNPLQPSTGSSTELKIVIEACFRNFDMVVPTPRFVTWQPQSGERQLTSMVNPVYEDITRLREIMDELETFTTCTRQWTPRKVAALVVASSTLLISATRLIAMCATGDLDIESLETATEAAATVAESFVPQSGIGGMISGLFDSAANGLKKVASDAIDAGRGAVRSYTGLHNANIPVPATRTVVTAGNLINTTDSQQFFEKLDPYTKFDRMVKEPIFGTSIDEMAISHIVSKRQMIGSIKVAAATKVGTLLWARPISPFQGGLETTSGDSTITCTNNIELMHTLHRAWRGDLKITIQSVMNNKQQCKLKLLKMYNPSFQALSKYPGYQSISNAPSHLMEFTQGGQEQEIALPFLCRNDLCPCAENTDVEAMFHGMYYIYLAQPLANSDGSPTEIWFNVYMSGEPNLTFYGYTTSNTIHDDYLLYKTKNANLESKPRAYISNMRLVPEKDRPYPGDIPLTFGAALLAYKDKEFDRSEYPHAYEYTSDATKLITLCNENKRKILRLNIKPYTSHYWKNKDNFVLDDSGRVKQYKQFVHEVWTPQSGTVEVMNEPQKQQNESMRDDKDANLGHMTRLMPTLDVRPLIRRMYKTTTSVMSLEEFANVNIALPLNSFLGENSAEWQYTPIETISRMYYGKTTGFKIRLAFELHRNIDEYIKDITALSARVYYVPQNIGIIDANSTASSAMLNIGAFGPPNQPNGEVPFPVQVVRQNIMSNACVLEFVIPDTCLYKFLGGPDKFNNFDSNSTLPVLSVADFGTIVLQLTNSERKPMVLQYELFMGLTDESRLGFHAMAPPFKIYKNSAFYLGSDSVVSDPIPEKLNPFVYFGGLP